MASDEYLGFFDEVDTFNIRDFKCAAWRLMPPDEQAAFEDQIFDFYRNRHGFPYPTMDEQDITDAMWKTRNKRAEVSEEGKITWDSTGSTLCNHFFPHLYSVPFRNKKTSMDAFQNDVYLRDAIRLCLKIKDGVAPLDLLGAFALGTKASVGVVSRFKPMAAKAIWERYAPEGGTCYDYACGWGGRLIGCLSSKKRLTYIGVDPESRTHACLLTLKDRLIQTYDGGEAHIHKVGSEDFCPPELEGKVDVSFSSPPYFNLERYSDDPTQSHVKFNNVDAWLNGFLRQTFTNIRTMLKPGGVLALNLLDFDKHQLVGPARELIVSLGFEPLEELGIPMVQRRGNGQNTERSYKYEPVYAYRKS